MFAFVVFDLVFQYWAKRLAEKNVSEMTYFVSGGTWNLNSVNYIRIIRAWMLCSVGGRLMLCSCLLCFVLRACYGGTKHFWVLYWAVHCYKLYAYSLTNDVLNIHCVVVLYSLYVCVQQKYYVPFDWVIDHCFLQYLPMCCESLSLHNIVVLLWTTVKLFNMVLCATDVA